LRTANELLEGMGRDRFIYMRSEEGSSENVERLRKEGVVGSELIGSWCGVEWGANSSAVTGLPMIGGDIGREMKECAGVAGFGEEVRKLSLSGREVAKINPSFGVKF
jgi:hypothetical protein